MFLSPNRQKTNRWRRTRKIPPHLIRPTSQLRQAQRSRAFSAAINLTYQTHIHTHARPYTPTRPPKMSVSSFGHHGKTPAAVVSVYPPARAQLEREEEQGKKDAGKADDEMKGTKENGS
jgi:hypothetical protein